jgi:hypothetical protein
LKNITNQKTLEKCHFFFRRNTLFPLGIFSFALLLRAIPEFLSGIYPVGFDVLQGYIPAVMALPDNSPMKLFGWAYSPLAIYLLWFVRALTGVDPNLLLKIAGPIFYGLLCVCFYFLMSRGLKWRTQKSFFVALIFLLQPAIMRMGWDQLREELGLSLLFILLAVTDCDVISAAKSRFNLFCIIILSILIIFSHQLAAVLLFAVVFWQLFSYKPKREASFRTTMLAILPALSIFVWQLSEQFLTPEYNNHFAPIQLQIGTGNFIFTNYFLTDPHFLGGNYITILTYAGSLLLYTAALLVPFAAKGFFKDKVFLPMLIWLSLASMSILVFPWYAFSQYWWWTLLLPIPLTIYLGEYLDKKHLFEKGRITKRKLIFGSALLLLGILAVGYASATIKVAYPYATTYIPNSMVEASIPFEDIPQVQRAIEWINVDAQLNSTVLVEERIQGVAYNHLRSDLQIRVCPSLLTLNSAVGLTPDLSNPSYAVWYETNVNYGTLSGLEVAGFGRIGVFSIQ